MVQNYSNFYHDLDNLHRTLKNVLEATGSRVDEILQTDVDFFNIFDPIEHYSFETIYVDVPKLNNVPSNQWENIMELEPPDLWIVRAENIRYDFSTHCSEMYQKTLLLNDNIEKSRNKLEEAVRELSHDVNVEIGDFQKKISGNVEKKINDSAASVNELIVVASLVESPANLGGLARTCEIYAVRKLVINDSKVITNKEFKSLSMTSQNWIDLVEVKIKNLDQYLTEMKNNKYVIVGAEQTTNSRKLCDYEFPKRCILLLG